MSKLFLCLMTTFFISCNPYKKFQQTNPTLINAKRVMFVVIPPQKVGLPLISFLAVCDSIFKKNNISQTVVYLNIEDIDGTTPEKDKIVKPLLKFRPDCLIFLMSDKFERNGNLTFVRYRSLIMPIDSTEYRLPEHTKDDKKQEPTYVATVKLTAVRSIKRDEINGVKAANNFTIALKKHLSNFQ